MGIKAHSDRLRLEKLSEEHAAAMLPVLGDERVYLYIPGQPYQTVENLQVRYRKLVAGPSAPDEIWWNFILFQRASQTPMGFVQATLMLDQRLAEVAYLLSPSHWGQGYATEALAWLLQQLRRRGDIDMAQAQIDERNLASIAVVKRLGFEFTKTVLDESSTDSIFQRALVDSVPVHRARRAV